MNGNGIKGPAAPDVGPLSKAQIAAQELLESILDLVLRILGKASVTKLDKSHHNYVRILVSFSKI